MKRAALYVLINSIVAGLLYAGFILHVEGARYLALFVLWLQLAVIAAALSPAGAVQMRAKGPMVPSWVAIPVAVAFIGFLVWHGAFLTAVVVLVALCAVQAVYSKLPADRNP